MQIKICNSGSDGNGYAICADGETLLLEAGCRFMDMKILLDFNISNIKGLCISHVHSDHYAFHKDYEKAGIKTFKPWEMDEKSQTFGGFKIKAFQVEHDVECYGFYIDVAGERIVFITDSFFCKYNFAKLRPTILMVECNYSDDLISENYRTDRIYLTHFGLNACTEFILSNKTDALKQVILLHLSSRNANEKAILEKISGAVGNVVKVDIADSKKIIEV